MVAEIIDLLLEDVVAIKTTIGGDMIETECKEKEKDEAVVNNNNNRILRDLQPQSPQAKKRASEELEGEVRDKKMKISDVIDLTDLSPEVLPIKNNLRAGMRFIFKRNNLSKD